MKNKNETFADWFFSDKTQRELLAFFLIISAFAFFAISLGGAHCEFLGTMCLILSLFV